MTIAKTLASATGNTAAYAKHGVIATGIGGAGFVAEYLAETKAAYLAKDAELAARRDEMRAIAAQRTTALTMPAVKRQRKLAA